MCWVVILFIGIGSVFGGVICDSVYSVCGVCVYGLFYSIFVSMVRMVSISSCISQWCMCQVVEWWGFGGGEDGVCGFMGIDVGVWWEWGIDQQVVCVYNVCVMFLCKELGNVWFFVCCVVYCVFGQNDQVNVIELLWLLLYVLQLLICDRYFLFSRLLRLVCILNVGEMWQCMNVLISVQVFCLM